MINKVGCRKRGKVLQETICRNHVLTGRFQEKCRAVSNNDICDSVADQITASRGATGKVDSLSAIFGMVIRDVTREQLPKTR